VTASAAVAEVAAWLDEVLDAARFREEEPENGLLVDAGRPITSIASAVNTTFAGIAAAAGSGAELMLVHHPSWPSIDRRLHRPKLDALREAGLSLYGAHASLDGAAEHGTGHELARLLGVSIEGRFGMYQGAQAGVFGTFEGGWDRLVAVTADRLGLQPESHRNGRESHRVAILTGAGGLTSWMEDALGLGCDTYVTGEGSMYARLYARETGMNLILGGHDLTERPGIEALGRRAAARFGLEHRFIEQPHIG
jgi:putative NIF3 family GTP cyclohydrolase 1 type 2